LLTGEQKEDGIEEEQGSDHKQKISRSPMRVNAMRAILRDM
jgi:hypothetical protein